MRLVRFLNDQRETRLGHDLGDGTADLLDATGDPGAASLVAAGPPSPTGRTVPIATRLAPVTPPAVYCIGLNYRKHAEETGAAIPDHPVLFMKPPSAVIAAGEPIRIPACCTRGDEVDYEVELAVVIGTPCRDVSERDALRHVAGYTVANDVSARRWQKHAGGGQWVRGKSFDTFCPLGPVLVTPDELPDPQSLRLTTAVNGETLQDSDTSDMIFTVAQILEYLSMDTTLHPGTVILTGTPQGVGVARKPPRFLRPGDTVTCAIHGVGELTNPVLSA